jgi:hypothetical protein
MKMGEKFTRIFGGVAGQEGVYAGGGTRCADPQPSERFWRHAAGARSRFCPVAQEPPDRI